MKLTDEHKQFIDDNFQRIPDLIELTRATFKDGTIDGRSKQGRAVREYLASKEIKYKTTKHEEVKPILLTEEQKQFIEQYSQDGMSSYQIAQLLFPDDEVKKLGREQRAVGNYLEAVKKRNKIAKTVNQLYGVVAANVVLAVLFNYIAIQLRSVRSQIASLSFPTAVPPGVGVPYSLISALEEVKKLLDRFIQQNKALNIALIIALIFFVVALIIISQILKTIDSLIFRCAPNTLPLVQLNQELQDLLDPEIEEEDTQQLVNGFILEVITVEKNSVDGIKRRQAVGKNQRGIIIVKGDESFSSSDQVLKDELAFYIKSRNLKAY